MPFRIAFLPLLVPLPVSFLIVESIIDWIFIADCVSRFYRPYFHESGYFIVNKSEIRKRYLQSPWFVIDMISAIPWDFLSLILHQANPALLQANEFWLRYVICTRLIRFPSIMARLLQWEVSLNWNISVIWFRATRIVLGLLIWIHVFSCIVNLIASVEDLPVTWRYFQEIPAQLNVERHDAFIFWLNGLYWGIITFNTVCYGDFHANTAGERAWLFFYIYLNIAFFAYITGSVVSWLQLLEHERLNVVKKLQLVKAYAKFRGLPDPLTHEMLRVVRFGQLIKKLEGDDRDYLLDLHPALRAEAAEHLRNEVLKSWELAHLLDTAAVTGLVVRLRRVIFQRGEDLMLQGSIGSRFFVLCNGEVAIMVNGLQKTVISEKGSHFGEGCLFDPGARRGYTVRALDTCEVVALSRDDFNSLLGAFPAAVLSVNAYAARLRSPDYFDAGKGPVGDISKDFLTSATELVKDD